ncbi:MFS transporter [Streptomyces sp. NPDC056165]|uniref:MFS transporter n=1 Tax=Streptomyces sp. NPDC056165 TaxID=3345733 RepID=UPI0035E1BABA
MDRIGFNRAHSWVLILVLSGMFFSALEENTTGAIAAGLKAAFGTTKADLALMALVETVGFVVGRLLAGYMGDRYGRRKALSVNLLLYTLGGLLAALSPNMIIMSAFRFVVGVGLGGEFTIGLALISEMVATRNRGSVSASLNIGSGGVGNFVSYGLFLVVLGPMNGILGGTELSWRWLLVMLAAPAVMVVFFRRYLPESPRFLLAHGKVDEANRVLTILASGRLQWRPTPEQVIPYLSASDVPTKTAHQRLPIMELFTRSSLRRLGSIGVASWMSFGANGTLFVLLPAFLLSEGYSVTQSLGFTMVMNFGGLLGACAAAYLAGRAGRKTVIRSAAVLGCGAGIAFATLANGAVLIMVIGALFKIFAMLLNTTLAAWWPEQFPTHVRARGVSILNAVSTSSSAIMPLISVAVFNAVGLSGVFVMFAFMYALVFVSAFIPPETQGRSLEEINNEQSAQEAG